MQPRADTDAELPHVAANTTTHAVPPSPNLPPFSPCCIKTSRTNPSRAQIPREYGGTSPNALGRSSDEAALKQLAASLGPTSLPPTTTAPLPDTSAGSGRGACLNVAGVNGEQSGVDALESGRGSSSSVAASGGGYEDTRPCGGGGGGDHVDVRAGGSGLRSGTSTMRTLRENSSVSAGSSASSGDSRGIGGRDGKSGGSANARQGMTQRLASVVRRMRGSATHAYLGVENKFRYDTERRMWIIDGDESDGGGRRGARDGADGTGRQVKAAKEVRVS